MPGLEDTDSEIDLEEDGFSDNNIDEAKPKHNWDQESKEGKSILKKKKMKDQNKKKTVKFTGVKEEEEESDSDDEIDNEDYMGNEEDSDGIDEFVEKESEEEEKKDEKEKTKIEILTKEKNLKRKRKKTMEDQTSSKKIKISQESEELKEDIYGRLRDKEGNIVKASGTDSYIPPAKRAMMSGGQLNEALHKKLKGLVNRLSEGTIQVLSNQVESVYMEHSRAEVNETLAGLITDAVIAPSLTPERLVAELAMLVAILHSNVGSEVGAFFLQKLAVKFKEFLDIPDYGIGKRIDNVLMLLSNLYNFKIVTSTLIIDVMKKLIDKFGFRDIELLLLLLKHCGFTLRKDDPAQLKQIIFDIQAKARDSTVSSAEQMESRVKFMLEILKAIRNNDMRKIPGYDPSHLEHLRKLIKSFLRGQMLGGNALTIGLEDLLKADQYGRWWIVGSAWEGRQTKREDHKVAKDKVQSQKTEAFGMSKEMLKMAKLQGMNTDVRKQIFCILGTSEDFEDAFARLLRVGLNRSQEREIIHIIFHCCLSEKEFNPFYAFLTDKFCSFDRRFIITVQFTMWDKFKEVDSMSKEERSNLGHLLSHLLLNKALPLSVLKVVEFGMESKKMIRLLVQVLSQILSSPNLLTQFEIFERIAPITKLKPLCQGLQVFMRVHLKGVSIKGLSNEDLKERIDKVESAMFSRQSMML